jgi:hypothetical protein
MNILEAAVWLKVLKLRYLHAGNRGYPQGVGKRIYSSNLSPAEQRILPISAPMK